MTNPVVNVNRSQIHGTSVQFPKAHDKHYGASMRTSTTPHIARYRTACRAHVPLASKTQVQFPHTANAQEYLVNLRRPFGIGLEEPFDEMLELLAALERVGVEAIVKIGKLAKHLNDDYLSTKVECRTDLPKCQMAAVRLTGNSINSTDRPEHE